MLKSSPIFKMNGAHLVEKKMFEKIKTMNYQSLNALNM
jgi:predicted peroxiredoxin